MERPLNLVYLSPHFPAQQHLYCRRLKDLGAAAFGIGDRSLEELAPEQRKSLTDYRKVGSLEDTAAVHGAVADLQCVYNRIDRVESHTEYWMPLEASLREAFDVPGFRPADLEGMRRKSRMKQVFREAGVPVARGILAGSPEEAERFADQVGFPLVIKPDIGVGATGTFRIGDRNELRAFLEPGRSNGALIEEFVEGAIVTFDGLTRSDGSVACCFSMQYSRGVMDVVNEDSEIVYYTHREIPEDLADLGRRAVRAFRIRERFFHIEFFRTVQGGLIALEANLRPPGGPSVDMFNYSCDRDLYDAWARVMLDLPVAEEWPRLYHCGFVNRKVRFAHLHTDEEILRRYGRQLVLRMEIPLAFRRAMGDEAYLIRTTSLPELLEAAEFIQAEEGPGSAADAIAGRAPAAAARIPPAGESSGATPGLWPSSGELPDAGGRMRFEQDPRP